MVFDRGEVRRVGGEVALNDVVGRTERGKVVLLERRGSAREWERRGEEDGNGVEEEGLKVDGFPLGGSPLGGSGDDGTRARRCTCIEDDSVGGDPVGKKAGNANVESPVSNRMRLEQFCVVYIERITAHESFVFRRS